MRRSLAKFSESEASNHTPPSADFTTTTPELKFSVHTGRFSGLSLVDWSGRSGRYRFSPPPSLVRADLHGLHPGLSFGARLEHLAVAHNDSGFGGRLLVHDGAFLRGGVLHYIKFRGGLSVGSAGHDCCACSRNKKLLHSVSSIVSVSLR